MGSEFQQIKTDVDQMKTDPKRDSSPSEAEDKVASKLSAQTITMPSTAKTTSSTRPTEKTSPSTYSPITPFSPNTKKMTSSVLTPRTSTFAINGHEIYEKEESENDLCNSGGRNKNTRKGFN